MAVPSVPPGEPTADVIALWYHYEEIAMHFNELIMQYRLQLIGGAGAIGTVASYLIGAKIKDVVEGRWLRALVCSGLLVLVAAAASLDLLYYDKLLRGAVDALLDFEMKHPQIQMSTRIENSVGQGKFAIWHVYETLLLLMTIFTAWSWYRYFFGPPVAHGRGRGNSAPIPTHKLKIRFGAATGLAAALSSEFTKKSWRRRPDLNRGSRFCRQGRDVYLVDSSCFLVGPHPSFSLVFGRNCSQIVPKCDHAPTDAERIRGDGGATCRGQGATCRGQGVGPVDLYESGASSISQMSPLKSPSTRMI
jgi:hypothetical protein